MANDYSDIINLPHYVSKKYPRMSISNRASQFAPFSALKGYDDMVHESGRLTDSKKKLMSDEICILNDKLCVIESMLGDKIPFTFTYFVKDKYKKGGKYVTKKGIVKKIDLVFMKIILFDGTIINIDDIIDIEGDTL